MTKEVIYANCKFVHKGHYEEDIALIAMQQYADQQTSGKDKEIAELKQALEELYAAYKKNIDWPSELTRKVHQLLNP